MPDYRGIFDTISYYAEKLSTLDNAINLSIINSKFAFMIAAKNKACAEAIKKMLDRINKGLGVAAVQLQVKDIHICKAFEEARSFSRETRRARR